MRKYPFYVALLLVGCGGNGDGFSTIEPQPLPAESASPEISELAVSPDTVSYMQGGGNVTATAEVSFSDQDLDIETMQVEMSDGNSQSIPLGTIETASGTLSEEFAVSTEVSGTLTVEIWLVDAVGNLSNRLSDEILVQNPVPEITSLTPDKILSGESGLELRITGTGFLEGATVTWDGADRTTRYVGDTQVVASILSSDLETPRTVSVRVRNPEPTAGASNELTFEVVATGGTEPSGFPILITETIDDLPPNGPIVNGGLDWDGGFVTFASNASNLVPGDTNDAYDLFVRDTCLRYIPDESCTPTMTRAVMGLGGAEPNGDIGWTETSPDGSLAVSFNGRYVAFVSSADNLVPGDTNGVDDVFLVDTCIESYPRTACVPGVIRVSVRNDGSQTTTPASYPAVADDGRYVVFVSEDPTLIAGDSNGAADVFMRDTCRGGGAGCTPSTVRISVTDAGGQANGASGEPVFTGRYVAFTSLADNLVPGDTNGLQDVFIRDTCIGEPGCTGTSTRLVSVGHLGDPADGASMDPQVSWSLSDSEGHDYHGRFVAFVSSATNLVADDTNGALDVFRRDTCTNEPGCTPSTVLISMTSTGAQVSGDSWGPGFLSWYGGSIPFVTAADGVVPGDSNGLADVYKWSGSTERISLGAGGAQTDGASYAPRMSHHFYGPWLITYVSEASNILPDAVDIPNNGNIYMDRNY
jgi:archaellum component FlaF (FlaF/FlaG flagellin family)